MHVDSHCDFSYLPPSQEKILPALVRQLTETYTRETVNSIVRDVDRFYKPSVPCRRIFNLKGVQKYYPDAQAKTPQKSFLHNTLSPVIKEKKSSTPIVAEERSVRKDETISVKSSVPLIEGQTSKPCFVKSISMYETDYNMYNYTPYDTKDFKSEKYICHDFIMAERYACYMQTNGTISKKNRDSVSLDIYANNMTNKVKKRAEQTGAGENKKSNRKSFPLMVAKGDSVSRMLGLVFAIFVLSAVNI